MKDPLRKIKSFQGKKGFANQELHADSDHISFPTNNQ